MTEKITLQEALHLVTYTQNDDGFWRVCHVKCNVSGSVFGSVNGNVVGTVYGNVVGYVGGNVVGTVDGTISGRDWQFIETPREKLKRLIEEGADKDQLLEAFNQLEDN